MKVTTYVYLGAGVLVLVAIAWIVAKGPTSAGKTAGKALVGGASDLAGGLLQGGLSVFGVPETDQSKCDACVAARNWWGALKFCPAGTALSAIFAPGASSGASSSSSADAVDTGTGLPTASTPGKADWQNRLEGVWL